MTYSDINQLLSCTRDDVAYIADPLQLEKNIRRFDSALKSFYPKSRMGYSYKTNYLPLFCRLASSLNMYAEVVSGMEYQLARFLNIDHKQIIFNGPDKKFDELETALLNGAMLNADSLDEMNRIIQIIGKHEDHQFRIGLRCRFGKYKGEFPSRFGLNWESGEVKHAAALVKNTPNCTLTGIHCHTSYDRSVSSYEERTRFMLNVADNLFDEPPSYIDIGGGFCGELPESIRRQRGDGPSYEEYAETIGTLFMDHYGEAGQTELIVEPGVGLVADAMSYACRVTAVKKQNGRGVAITSGSIEHLKIVPNEINLPMTAFSENQTHSDIPKEQTHVTGYTCLEHDILYSGYEGKLVVGDIVVFNNIGAYSLSASPNFIRTTPPVFLQKGNVWLKLCEQMEANLLFKQLDFNSPTEDESREGD